MEFIRRIENNALLQYLIGIASIFLVSLVCVSFVHIIGYHVVALILLLVVSILAMFFNTWPIVVTAILSALTWNFLFIQPHATFNINTPQDALLFLMYFVIAVMNAVFTSKIRKVEQVARQRKEREKTLQLYNTLLNSLSHELKTPISAIIGAVDALKAGNGISENIRSDLYSEIEIAGNRLHRQVNNLLSMSRLESHFLKLQLDWYDINEIIYAVIDLNSKDAEQHKLIFEPDEKLPLFKVDGALIEQIIHNILHNALHYTKPGSTVKLSAGLINDQLEIEISDNGTGFPENKLNMVFEKFYRLPNSAAGGTGLGLSIAIGFARAHNGTIELHNNPEGGANFRVIIPAEKTSLVSTENE